MSSSEPIRCRDCDLCLYVGFGEGICDFYGDVVKNKFVRIDAVNPDCPRVIEKERHEKGI